MSGSHGNQKKCHGCKGCAKGCDACDNSGCGCSDGPSRVQGTGDTIVFRTGKNFAIPSGEGFIQVDATTAEDAEEPTLITLPAAPRKGDTVLVHACEGDVEVEGGCADICDQDEEGVVTVPACGATLFTYSSCCKWIPLAGATKKVIITGDDVTIVGSSNQTIKATDDITVTLPANPAEGQEITLLAFGGDITVLGNGSIIAPGGQLIPQGTGATLAFANGTWLLVGGAPGAFGQGQIVVPDIAALAALVTTSLPDQVRAFVLTLRAEWELDKTSTAAVDGRTGAVPVTGPGRWLRLHTPSKHWANQIIWFFDSINGDDENDGSVAVTTPGTRIGPTKTAAEVNQRLVLQALAGVNYQVNGQNSVPFQEAVERPFASPGTFVSDHWFPNFAFEQNPYALQPANPITGVVSGNEQVFNMTLNGKRTVLVASSTLSYTPSGNVYPEPATGNQATVVDASGILAANVGNMIQILTDANPLNVGAVGWIGLTGAPLAANTARVSDLIRRDNTAATAMAGATYRIVTLIDWNPSVIQIDASGRFQLNDWRFPQPAGPPPADQVNLTHRNCNYTYRTCKFERPIQPSFGSAATIQASAFDFRNAPFGNSNFRNGVNGTTIVNMIGGAFTWSFNLMLNTDWRLIAGTSFEQVASMYLQGSRFATKTISTVADYGFTLGGAATRGVNIQLAGNGIGIYDWPVDLPGALSGFLISDDACVRVGTGATIRGLSTTAGSIGVNVQASSKLLWDNDGVANPNLNTPSIRGVVAEVRITNTSPGGVQGFAVAVDNAGAGNPMIGAGPVTYSAAPLTLWSQWAAAPFKKFAKSQFDESLIALVAN